MRIHTIYRYVVAYFSRFGLLGLEFGNSLLNSLALSAKPMCKSPFELSKYFIYYFFTPIAKTQWVQLTTVNIGIHQTVSKSFNINSL